MSEQSIIDNHAQKMIDFFGGKNSSIAVLSMLSAIEMICLNEKASDDFRRSTSILLNDQALRINGFQNNNKDLVQ